MQAPAKIIKAAKACSMCVDKVHKFGTNCPVNQLKIKGEHYNQQYGNQRPCYNCHGPHNLAQCPLKQSSNPNQQI